MLIENECNRIKEFVHAAWIVQKCYCSVCANRKKETEAFYERFDALYKDYITNSKSKFI